MSEVEKSHIVWVFIDIMHYHAECHSKFRSLSRSATITHLM